MLRRGSNVLVGMKTGTPGGRAPLLALVVALLLSACTIDPGGVAEGDDDQEVAQTPQALGGWTTLRTSFLSGTHLGPKVAALGGLNSPIEFVDRVTGSVLFTESTSTFFTRGVIASDATTVFMVASRTLPPSPISMRIYSRSVATLPSAWREVTSVSVREPNAIFLDPTHVYWADMLGIHKVPRGGGLQSTISTREVSLSAIDGTTLYYRAFPLDGGIVMGRIEVNGSGDRILGGVPELFDLSFDASYFWGVTFGGKVMYRVDKSTLALKVFGNATDRTYHDPISTGAALYWFENRASGVVTRRKNLVNGNVVSVDFPERIPSYVLFDNAIYTLGGSLADSGTITLLIRGNR
jgi:hypothetical protein